MIVNTRIIDHIIRDKKGVLARCDSADLICAKRNPPVISIDMGISAGTGHEVKAGRPVVTDMRTFRNRSTDTPLFTEISWTGNPDPCKICPEYIDDTICNPFQFFLKGCS